MVKKYKLWLEQNGTETGKKYRWSKITSYIMSYFFPGDDASPPFPLLPVSKGFQITLSKTIASFDKLLASIS